MTKEDRSIFMNLMTDYGFKRLFGTERFKSVLVRFLNIMFAGEGINVTDVVYHNKELLPVREDSKMIVYDVYCTSHDQQRHFILEMQQAYHPKFEERALYYTYRASVEQVLKGGSYDIKPVYSIFFINFHFSHLPKRLIHNIRLYDTVTKKIYSDSLRVIFLCLPETAERWEDCKTDLDKVLFIIKNMHKMDKDSKPYRSGELSEMFEAAEIGSLAAEESIAYSQSRMKYEEIISSYRHNYDYGYSEGKEEGRKEGRKEGMEEANLQTAINLIKAGIPYETISLATGLPIEQVRKLR